MILEISIPSSSTVVSEMRPCALIPNTWKTRWLADILRNKKFVILDLQQSTVMSYLIRWRETILKITIWLVQMTAEQVWLILMERDPQIILITISKESQIPLKCPKLRSRSFKKKVSSTLHKIVMTQQAQCKEAQFSNQRRDRKISRDRARQAEKDFSQSFYHLIEVTPTKTSLLLLITHRISNFWRKVENSIRNVEVMVRPWLHPLHLSQVEKKLATLRISTIQRQGSSSNSHHHLNGDRAPCWPIRTLVETFKFQCRSTIWPP